ncbi:MAG: RnfABCDGE type electron transport complex subunit B [Lentisphaeria bacterium]|jgi:electron transport complex protein RnfB
MLTAVLVLAATGLVLGVVIGIVVKLFAVHPDPKREAVEALLPGANCGGCGFAGCADFARALMAGEAEPGLCPSNTHENIAQIAMLLGLGSIAAREPKVAVVRCGADRGTAASKNYNGVTDCKSAALVGGGDKVCAHGCLGYGTCSRACPYNAIEMLAGGLAVVHADLCVGCGKCVSTCPRKLIQLVPKSAPVHVYCNSPAKGADKLKFCKTSCIGCRKCVKAAEGKMKVEGFLASVNYAEPPGPAVCEVCPTHCLRPTVP